MQSDESRRQRFLCCLAHSDNPARKFEWGNLITLKDNIGDDDLYEAVHEFRKRHYSSHRMTLTIQVVWNFNLLVICCMFCISKRERGRGIANVKVCQDRIIKFVWDRLAHLCRTHLTYHLMLCIRVFCSQILFFPLSSFPSSSSSDVATLHPSIYIHLSASSQSFFPVISSHILPLFCMTPFLACSDLDLSFSFQLFVFIVCIWNLLWDPVATP